MTKIENGVNTPTTVQEYFESIKGNHAALRQFFTAMPKGGDVHNHLTGSAYAETYFELAAKKGMYVNLETGKLYKEKPEGVDTIQLSKEMDDLHNHRMTLIDKWSIRNFQPYKYPLGPDEYFFGTFGLLSALTSDIDDLAYLMHELKVRAAKENVQYLEVIGIAPHIPEKCFLGDKYDEKDSELKKIVKEGNIVPLRQKLEEILDLFKESKEAEKVVDDYDESVRMLDKKSNEITSHFHVGQIVCRYQGYAVRNLEPLMVFAQMYVVFNACLKNYWGNLLTGCNIVAAENGEKSMMYYTAHMLMFSVLKDDFKKQNKFVNVSLHAGELTLGLVRPEHLTYHIQRAVDLHIANRIGHGVDLPFEEVYGNNVIYYMKEYDMAVEINLTSNEFILGVKESEHPIMLYHNAGVPIIISTDDPGILRTSLTEQYVLATLRYGFSYNEIKQFVYNSIEYAFLRKEDKKSLKDKLNNLFVEFEEKYEKSSQQTEERCAKSAD